MNVPGSRLLLGLLIALLLVSAEGKTDPDTGKCRVIWVGEISSNNEMVLDWIAAEPRMELTRAVPCDLQLLMLDEAKRFARIYLPRSYDSLMAGTDVAIFHDFHPKVLPVGSIEWFRHGVESGMGLCLIEFAYRVASYAGMNEWPLLRIYDAFPGKFVINQIEAIYGRQFYEVVREGPLLDLPGLEKQLMNWGWHGDLEPRQGAVTWAIWRGRRTPALVTGQYGEGMVIQADHGWDTIPQGTKRKWQYVTDYVYNNIIFVAGLAFPEDVELVHHTRVKFVRYRDERAMILLMIDFIERFGANPAPFEMEMGEMEGRLDEAESLYIDAQIERSAQILDELLEGFADLNDGLLEAKDRVMVWIYVSEWLAVTGTSMGCGFALWTLMVKRRYYREIGVTRTGTSARREWKR
jgi:hypothetical protein